MIRIMITIMIMIIIKQLNVNVTVNSPFYCAPYSTSNDRWRIYFSPIVLNLPLNTNQPCPMEKALHLVCPYVPVACNKLIVKIGYITYRLTLRSFVIRGVYSILAFASSGD